MITSFDGLVNLGRYLLTVAPSVSITVLLLIGIVEYRPDIIDSENRIVSTPLTELRKSYDFIIVGGGSAGCVLASRLSEINHWNILLLEAGGDEPLLMDIPALSLAFQRGPWDWNYKTEPSPNYCLAMRNNRCYWPRGKVLGGCSAINAMLYIRGNRRDYDLWESMGNPGWSYDDVLPYFKKMENMRVKGFGYNSFHGYDGPLSVESFRSSSPLKDIFLDAARQLNVVSIFNSKMITLFAQQITPNLHCSFIRMATLMEERRRDLLLLKALFAMDYVVVQIRRI